MHYDQDNGAVIPRRVHTVVVSVQHDDFIELEEQKAVLKEKVIKAVVPAKYLDEDTIYHLQPSGRFVIGGPQVPLGFDSCWTQEQNTEGRAGVGVMNGFIWSRPGVRPGAGWRVGSYRLEGVKQERWSC